MYVGRSTPGPATHGSPSWALDAGGKAQPVHQRDMQASAGVSRAEQLELDRLYRGRIRGDGCRLAGDGGPPCQGAWRPGQGLVDREGLWIGRGADAGPKGLFVPKALHGVATASEWQHRRWTVLGVRRRGYKSTPMSPR